MYSCNGSVFLDKKIGKLVIKISGDHREDVAKFFYEEGIAEHENIKIHGA
jgi:translation initiation factor 1 (eIF-1/SUI1)